MHKDQCPISAVLERQTWSHAIEGVPQMSLPLCLTLKMSLHLSGFYPAEGQWNVTHRMTMRIQQDLVRTNLAHGEGAETAHMPTHLAILAQSLPW